MSKLKSIFKKIPIIRKAYFYFFKPQSIYNSGYWISKYIPNKLVSIVQIGSNDGVSGDPIYHLVKKNKLWNVLFVEPVLPIFKILKENYGNESRFKFENAGINLDGSNQYFYTVDENAYLKIPDLSEEYKQIGSFDKNHILKLSKGELKEYISEVEVNCLTLEQLLTKNKIKSIDLFLIDAEGYDWKILSQLDLNIYKPTIIVFEYCNLDDIEKQNAIEFLSNQYFVFSFRINLFCIRKEKLENKDLKRLNSKLVNC